MRERRRHLTATTKDSEPLAVASIPEQDVDARPDAGIGMPSDAVRAMEAGAHACLINTAVSRSDDPPIMAAAMRLAVIAGRLGSRAGRMPRREFAVPSSPVAGLVGAGLA